MTYYVMADDDAENDEGEALFDIQNCFEVGAIRSWSGGRLITEKVTSPILIDYEPFRGFQGPPCDLWDDCIPLMSRRLGDAIIECGVDNIQLFPAVLRDTNTGETYEYYAFNVVGLVSAADLSNSDAESFDGRYKADTSFYSLAIEKANTHGLLMFRLAENVGAILVHERVRNFVVSRGIPEERFIEPENWAQI